MRCRSTLSEDTSGGVAGAHLPSPVVFVLITVENLDENMSQTSEF